MTNIMDRKEQLYAALHAQLDRKFAAAAAAGVDASVFDDVDAIAAAMVAALPVGTVYDQLAGPFYDTAGLTRWLGISKQALAKRVDAGTVIACRQEDDRRTWVYPAWQFADRAVVPGLAEIWQILREGAAADPWMAVFWLKATSPAFGGVSPVEWLQAGGDPDAVVDEARADAARWAA